MSPLGLSFPPYSSSLLPPLLMMKPQGLRLLYPQGKKETDMTASSLVKGKGGKTLQHFFTITLDKKSFLRKKTIRTFFVLAGTIACQKRGKHSVAKTRGRVARTAIAKKQVAMAAGTQQVHFPSSLFLPDPSSFGKRAEK